MPCRADVFFDNNINPFHFSGIKFIHVISGEALNRMIKEFNGPVLISFENGAREIFDQYPVLLLTFPKIFFRRLAADNITAQGRNHGNQKCKGAKNAPDNIFVFMIYGLGFVQNDTSPGQGGLWNVPFLQLVIIKHVFVGAFQPDRYIRNVFPLDKFQGHFGGLRSMVFP